MRYTPILLGLALVLAAAMAFGSMALTRGDGAPAEAAVSAPGASEIVVSNGAGLPDLVVTDISFNQVGSFCNPAFAIFVTVRNVGDAMAGTSSVNLNGSQEPVPPLPADTSSTAQFMGSFGGFLTATADSGELVVESDETNNSLTVPPFPTPSPTPTCTPAVPDTPTPSPTGGNPDGDGIPNGIDNCPAHFNPGQENNDRNFIAMSTPLTQDDLTRAKSDHPGDVCDDDDDNDGFVDVGEPAGQCGGHNTDPLRADTDGDGVHDLAECAYGGNPTNPAIKPSAATCAAQIGSTVSQDRDGDRIKDYAEFCAYNTNHYQLDSDSDGTHDGCEAVSLNSDQVVNSGDQLLLAYGIIGDLFGPPNGNADVNKDGAVNSGDQLMMAFMIVPAAQCPSGGPDLVVDSMRIELETLGECYTSTILGVRAFVRNQGAVAAGPFVVSINNVEVPVAGLAPGATVSPWAPGHGYPALEHAVADSDNVIAETDEFNNELFQAVPIPTLPVPCTSTPTATASPTATATPTATPTPVVNTFTNTGSVSTGYAAYGYESYGVYPLSPAGSVIVNASGCGTPTVLALRDFSLRLFVSVEWPTQCLDPGESFTVSLEGPSPGVPGAVSALWPAPVPSADLVNPGAASSYVVVEYRQVMSDLYPNQIFVTDPPGCSGASVNHLIGTPPFPPFPVSKIKTSIEYSSACIDPGETLSIAFNPPLIEEPTADFSLPPP